MLEPDARTIAHMNEWLDLVYLQVQEQAPALLPIYNIYADEARFGRRYIDEELQLLDPGDNVLEVGAGAMLLSCQLAREGFNITALEPTGAGFSHFSCLRSLALYCADQLDCRPNIIELPAEALVMSEEFSFAFSVNVMEHVDSVESSIENIGRSLRLGGKYRFTCPNYLFPYEPHFNMPTLFSKSLTERLLNGYIFNASHLTDPSGTWRSLNWINVLQIKKCTRRSKTLRATFNRGFLTQTLERVNDDKAFAARRSAWMRMLIRLVVRLRLHHSLMLVPAAVQPIIDCTIKKDGSR
ncbi:class I SAM-dependent methyltransferase [Pollutimonas thiosulfatoxidans]|uniref:Methyltransferase type 11 domain-containing protein n=1 Tax=Pollutimonas thiosulfatoxidans TaxID=2028345 RepID=A0A410GEG9_9BURK|nr:methyltransferase domain-containing protein [Pollutimonas thiosulfatoxidans]QAA94692.1 hypothetical protein CKA81_13205 [Pollutimonas thiosulfatoxidans]